MPSHLFKRFRKIINIDLNPAKFRLKYFKSLRMIESSPIKVKAASPSPLQLVGGNELKFSIKKSKP